MSQQNANFVPLPLPPEEYDQRYMDQLIRSLNNIIEQLINPGPEQGEKLNLSNPISAVGPGEPAGLRSGDVWIDTASSLNILKRKA